MADRFPKDCWKKNCPHFHIRDLSIDDLVCTCDLLKIQCDACDENWCFHLCPLPNDTRTPKAGMINSIIVPIESFYDYFKSGKYPTSSLKSICCNVCSKKSKSNYKKFAKRIKKAIKYLPPELQIEIREAVNGDERTFI